ncbi:MAG: hypothetical protein ACJ71J_01400 [Nitrososphaeraceae archaeon]
MRLPIKDNNHFSKNVNFAFENLRSIYLEAIRPQLLTKKVNVMLADGSIAQSHTFEPEKVTSFFQRLIDSLKGWTTTGILSSNTDDLHRIYCQFTQEVGKYYLHGYFGIQFHALPYYRTDKRIIQIQRELAHIVDRANKTFKLISDRGNDIVHKELESTGHAEMGSEEFFIKLFEDKNLLEDLERKALLLEDEFPEFKEMHNRKIELFAELNKLVIELYQISPVSMDYDKLTQGEEGVVTYFDIEAIKNKKTKERDSYVDTKRIDVELTEQIVRELSEVGRTLHNIS